MTYVGPVRGNPKEQPYDWNGCGKVVPRHSRQDAPHSAYFQHRAEDRIWIWPTAEHHVTRTGQERKSPRWATEYGWRCSCTPDQIRWTASRDACSLPLEEP